MFSAIFTLHSLNFFYQNQKREKLKKLYARSMHGCSFEWLHMQQNELDDMYCIQAEQNVEYTGRRQMIKCEQQLQIRIPVEV